nr:unnamed protein product [Spirometra erinaceieuropaei]
MFTMRTRTGRAIVSFATPEDALEAFYSAHGQSVHKCPIVVNFKLRKIKKRKTASKTAADPTASTLSTNGVDTSTATAMPKPNATGVTSGTPKSAKKKQKKRSKKHASQTGTPLEVSVRTAKGESASSAATKPDSAVSSPSTNPKLEKSALETGTPVTKKRNRSDAHPLYCQPKLPPCESSAWEEIAKEPDHLYKV